jgi:K(+)-stimulated pyrophosphate-energized sodium pump
MNPVIKFTTLFGLLAVELGVYMAATRGPRVGHVLALVCFVISVYFVWRSFYRMRIEGAHSS